MSTYLLSYDLIRQQDYPRIIEAIKSYGNWAHPLESVWLIKTDVEINLVTTHLRQYIDADDKLLVMDVTSDHWMAYSLAQDVSSWMQVL